jgi:hypothetical protein
VSERAAIGMAKEAAVGNRHGGDRTQDGKNSGLKGESRDIAAREAGFGNGKTYEQAKRVVQQGAPELVAAADASC